ncbi:MAG: 16S rRNA (guanine(966)-N(2))-methyltransferase RsmD [bacterium]
MRISGGLWLGRTLKVPPQVRATTDRVREALFSILGSTEAKSVLDLYAGSGALGIEALSRGAVQVTFVDLSRTSLLCIQKNLPADSDRDLRFHRQDAIEFLKRAPHSYDWIFCDPPYGQVDYSLLLWAFSQSRVMSEGSLLILETDRHQTFQFPIGLELDDQRRFGDTLIHFLRRNPTKSNTTES